MTELEEWPFEKLPDLAAQFASSVRLANEDLATNRRGLFNNSLPRADLIQVIGSSFRWHFSLVKKGKKVSFFFRRKFWEEVVIEASLALSLKRVAPEQVGPDAPARFAFIAPPFVIPAETLAQQHKATHLLVDGRPLPTLANTLLIQGPGGLLAAVIDQPNKDPPVMSFQYNPTNGPAVATRRDDPFPARPFIELLESIRQWCHQDPMSGQELPLSVDPQGSDVDKILTALAASRQRAAAEVVPEADQPLRIAFGVETCSATVALRLDETGNLATDFGKQNFQLRMHIKVDDLGSFPLFRVALTLPDFLVCNSYREKLLDAILDVEMETELTAVLARLQPPVSTDLLALTRDDALMFRSKRKQEAKKRIDTTLFAFRISMADVRHILILRVRFEDHEQASASPKPITDSVKVLFYAAESDLDKTSLDPETRNYFHKLLNVINRWVEVLL